MFTAVPLAGGTFALLATLGAVTTYTNTGLSGATNYYYKIAAYDTNSFESAATSEVTGKTMAADSGGIMGGGGGGGSAPTPVYTVIPGTELRPSVGPHRLPQGRQFLQLPLP